MDRRSQQDLEKAIKIYEQALAIDSLDAMAWAYLSSAYLTQAMERYKSPEEGFPKAVAASVHAITLDDNCAQAHQSLGVLKIAYEWDWEGARKELTRALELDPANISALRNLGVLHGVLGNFPECFRLLNESISRDPLKPITFLHLIMFQINANHLEEASKTLDTYSHIVSGTSAESPYYFCTALIYVLQNKPHLALKTIESGTPDQSNSLEFIRTLAYHLLGNKKLSDENLQQYIAGQPRAGGTIAKFYAFRNDKDMAFKWMTWGIENKHFGLTDLKISPLFDNLRDDPRYNEALKKMKLPPD
jgi:tetratricopeptide (TPR) repeat protein